MGTLGGGNGGDRPFDGGNQPEGLSGLPPEWGLVVVPDDPGELAEEAAEVRRNWGGPPAGTAGGGTSAAAPVPARASPPSVFLC